MIKWNEYQVLYHKIPYEDLPNPGQLYICLDPQKRLGEKTWSVSLMGNGTSEGDTVQLGLFWRIENARLFALVYYNQVNKPDPNSDAEVDENEYFFDKDPRHDGETI